MAFDHSSLRRFEASTCMAAPRGLLSSPVQHGCSQVFINTSFLRLRGAHQSDYRYSMMITNDEEAPPEEIWREYRPRANDENVIKDLKEGYGLAAFNMNSFWATESFMVVNAMVFCNLVHYLNRTILNKNTPKEHLKTLRPRWFIIPAQLGNTGGIKILRLSMRNSNLKARLIDFLDQIGRIPHSLNCIAVET